MAGFSMADALPMSKLPTAHSPSKRVTISYVFDYVIIVVLLGGFLALDAIEPFHQQFSLRNYTLQYKFAVHERVTNLSLVIIAVACPATIIAIYTLLVDGIFSHKVSGRKRKYTWRERLWELNCGLLGLGLAICLQYVIVGSLKNAIGKPRPDLIDRCQPKEGAADPLPFGLSEHSICTQTNNAILKDGFRSFPSGHSSTSFAGLFYLSLYLAGKIHVLDARGEVWKMFVVLTPSLGAALVAGSRIMDARHHPFDVLSGSLIGIIIGWTGYRQYFPPISNFKAKGRAYPIRTWAREPLSGNPRIHDFDDQIPLAQDEEESRTTFVSGQNSPPAGQQVGGNHFRNEILAAQRQRRQASTAAVPPSQQSGINPFGGHIEHGRNDAWDDDNDSEEYELQQQYTLSDPPTQYDPLATNLGAQDTSYRSQSAGPPVGRLPSMRSPVGAKISMLDEESVAGAGLNVESGPPPPPHSEGISTIARKNLAQSEIPK